MDVSTASLPDYERPPLVETVIGVQFDRLAKFTNAHLGACWKTLDVSQWPKTEDAPPLPRQVEEFSDAARWSKGIRLQLPQDQTGRLQIKNADADRMIQLQNNRLHFNWLGKSGQPYPWYAQVRREFEDLLCMFIRYVDRENIGDFRPHQWELTYVNHIPKGTVWNTPEDWNFFLPCGAFFRLRVSYTVRALRVSGTLPFPVSVEDCTWIGNTD